MNIIILTTFLLIAFLLTIYTVKIERQQNKEFKELMRFLRKRERERLRNKDLIKKYTEEKRDF